MMKVIVLLLMIGGFAFGLSQIFAPASTNAASNIESEKDMSHLTDMQKYVTQHDGTEPPFQNEYWDHKEPGIYVDMQSSPYKT